MEMDYKLTRTKRKSCASPEHYRTDLLALALLWRCGRRRSTLMRDEGADLVRRCEDHVGAISHHASGHDGWATLLRAIVADIGLEAQVPLRPHQGPWCFDKTPMLTFLDAMPITKEKMIAA